jgi:hypothetical protein
MRLPIDTWTMQRIRGKDPEPVVELKTGAPRVAPNGQLCSMDLLVLSDAGGQVIRIDKAGRAEEVTHGAGYPERRKSLRPATHPSSASPVRP